MISRAAGRNHLLDRNPPDRRRGALNSSLNELGLSRRGFFGHLGAAAAVGGLPFLAHATATPKAGAPRVTVCGLGGTGGNLLHRYVETGGGCGARTLCIDTDAVALGRRSVDRRLLLSPPGVAMHETWPPVEFLFARHRDEIAAELEGCDLLILVAGLGGNCATRLAPEVARLGRESGAVVTAITVTPFFFEGARTIHAEAGKMLLARSAHWIVSVPMDVIAAKFDPSATFLDVVEIGDRIALNALRESTSNAATILGAFQGTEPVASKQAEIFFLQELEEKIDSERRALEEGLASIDDVVSNACRVDREGQNALPTIFRTVVMPLQQAAQNIRARLADLRWLTSELRVESRLDIAAVDALLDEATPVLLRVAEHLESLQVARARS